MNNKEEILCKHVEYNNIGNVQRLLDQGNSAQCHKEDAQNLN